MEQDGKFHQFYLYVPPQTVLLKADTGADVNLMNRQTFDQLFGKAQRCATTNSYQDGKLEIQQ